MDASTLGKSVSVFLKMEELEKLQKLQKKGIKIIEIFRAGIEFLEQKEKNIQ